jgi:hypothetical protein
LQHAADDIDDVHDGAAHDVDDREADHHDHEADHHDDLPDHDDDVPDHDDGEALPLSSCVVSP